MALPENLRAEGWLPKALPEAGGWTREGAGMENEAELERWRVSVS